MIQNKDKPAYVTVALNNDVSLCVLGNQCRTTPPQRWPFKQLNKGQYVTAYQIRFTGDDHTHDIVHGSDVDELVASR